MIILFLIKRGVILFVTNKNDQKKRITLEAKSTIVLYQK